PGPERQSGVGVPTRSGSVWRLTQSLRNLAGIDTDMRLVQVVMFAFAILGWVTVAASLTWNIVSWLFFAGRAVAEAHRGADGLVSDVGEFGRTAVRYAEL